MEIIDLCISFEVDQLNLERKVVNEIRKCNDSFLFITYLSDMDNKLSEKKSISFDTFLSFIQAKYA